MVNKDNTSITKPEDVKGKKVCSVTGSTPAAHDRGEVRSNPRSGRHLLGLPRAAAQQAG